MGRSQETFNKKEVRNKKEKKRKQKLERKQAKREEKKDSFDDMIAYVDANGNITSTPPDELEKEEINAEDIELGVPSREEQEDVKSTGTVSFFNHDKGYGFITDSSNKQKLFVHINNVDGDINEGNKVSFDVEKGPKGLVAVNVEMVKN